MATRKRWNGDFVIQTNENLASEYLATVAPFFLGSRGGTKNIFLRQAVEAVIAMAVNIWTVTDVSGDYTVDSEDHVLLVDSSSARTITLPEVSSQAGRILLIKDKTGNAETNNITIARAGSDIIDDMQSISIRVDFGAVGLISGNGSEWHTIWLV